MEVVWILLAVIAATWLARGALDLHQRGHTEVWEMDVMSALAVIAGGSVYAVGLFDSRAIPQFSWPIMAITILATWGCLWLIRSDREYRELVGIYINSAWGLEDETIPE